MAEESIRIFVSYAREDEEERSGLTRHLKTIPGVAVWDDRAIPKGSEWDGQISKELTSADIILLLISKDFLNSEYVRDVEIKTALERHEAGTVIVIPVLLKSCIWEPHVVGKFQALPSDETVPPGKNWVTSDAWHTLDDAFTNVARGVMGEVERIRDERSRRREEEQREHDEKERERLRMAAETSYRNQVAEALLGDGEITDIERRILDKHRRELALTEEQADRIEKGELQPLEEKRKNIGEYETALRQEMEKEYPFSKATEIDLTKYREALALPEEVAAEARQRVVEQWEAEEAERKARAEAELAEASANFAADPPPKERKAAETSGAKSRGESSRLDALTAARGSISDPRHLLLGTDIPDAKRRKARDVCGIADNEKILGLIDLTLFGSAANCWVFTERGLYYHNSDDNLSIPYADLKQRKIRADVDGVKVARKQLLSVGNRMSPNSGAAILKAIQRHI